MAVRLCIDFVGLFAFARGSGLTHVLLPGTKGGAHAHDSDAGAHEHFACIYPRFRSWDEPGDGKRFGTSVLRIRTRPASSPADLPADVIRVGKYTSSKFDRALLTAKPDGVRLAARIEVAVGGTMIGQEPAIYSIKRASPHEPSPDETVTRFPKVRIETTIPSPQSLVIETESGDALDASSEDAATMWITVCHLPEQELPPNPPPVVRPPHKVVHFDEYRRLFDPPRGMPTVTFLRIPKVGPDTGGSTKTCPAMIAEE